MRKASVQIRQGCLVVSLLPGISDEEMLEIREGVLQAVREKDLKGVVFDLASVDLLDHFLAERLIETAKAASFMGAEPTFSGLRPELALTLLDFGLDLKGIRRALTVDDAFEVLGEKSHGVGRAHRDKPGTGHRTGR